MVRLRHPATATRGRSGDIGSAYASTKLVLELDEQHLGSAHETAAWVAKERGVGLAFPDPGLHLTSEKVGDVSTVCDPSQGRGGQGAYSR